jgi:ketosteroid isomerase-like protein
MKSRTAHLIKEAINAHDLDALVSCFSDDVVSEQPAHPARSFIGRDQVRTNWATIFGMVPDLKANLIRSTVEDGVEWAEWAWDGTRNDGAAFSLRGTTIHGVENGRVRWVHFYMEPPDAAGENVQAAIGKAVGAR